MPVEIWKQQLIDNSYYFFKSCNCGGTYQEKFKTHDDPDIMIRVAPKKNYYSVIVKNRTTMKGALRQIEVALQALKKQTV